MKDSWRWWGLSAALILVLGFGLTDLRKSLDELTEAINTQTGLLLEIATDYKKGRLKHE